MIKHLGGCIPDEKGYHLYSIPPECIISITFGCRMSPEHRNEIIRIIQQQKPALNHVKIERAEIDEKEFKLNFTKFD
jgi:hypothetical protein